MSDLTWLVLFWMIPVITLVAFFIAAGFVARRQAKQVHEWKRLNELLSDRVEQSSARIEAIEKKLKDKGDIAQ